MARTKVASSECSPQVGLRDPLVRPGFFIVGAPRCGTTALYRWLRQHPQIYLPDIKECHYFADDLVDYRKTVTEQEYLSLFESASGNHRAVGEASVMYLSSQVAIDNLLMFNPAGKIIVTLRNPIEMLHSWHGQLVVTQQEDVQDFDKAWSMQVRRLERDSIPKTCQVPEALQYAWIGRLGAQVSRLFEKCERTQVHFIVYDDLEDRPEEVYCSLLHWLGVDSDGRSDFSRINQNRAIPSPRLNQFWQRNRMVRQQLRVMRRILGDSIYDRTRDLLVPHMSRIEKRKPLSTNMRECLRTEFSEDVALLSELVGRDFTYWLDDDLS